MKCEVLDWALEGWGCLPRGELVDNNKNKNKTVFRKEKKLQDVGLVTPLDLTIGAAEALYLQENMLGCPGAPF